MLLNDKVVFITGGARGIGYGIAGAVLEAGARVAIGDLDERAVTSAADSLAAASTAAAGAVFATAIDVADEASVEQALDAARSHFGVLNGLVNNAGVVRLGQDLGASVDDWQVQMQVNVIGTHLCCRAFARMLIDAGKPGSVVNIASNCGKVGYPNMAGYNASKAAVINLTRSLSAEWSEHDINVNALCPGGVYTPMLSASGRNRRQTYRRTWRRTDQDHGACPVGPAYRTLEIGRVRRSSCPITPTSSAGNRSILMAGIHHINPRRFRVAGNVPGNLPAGCLCRDTNCR